MNELSHRLQALLLRTSGAGTDPVGDPARASVDEPDTGLARHLQRLLDGLSSDTAGTVAPGVVGFGARVIVEDPGTGERTTHHLMSSEAMDPDQNHISLESPVGAALLGAAEGAVVDVRTPMGQRSLRVAAVQSLVDQLAVLEAGGDVLPGRMPLQ